jgi:hypothetical protein
MQNQLIAQPKAPLAFVKPTAANEFKPLVIGSTPVDEMLARHHVPKGSLLHFDYVGDPDLHLLSICRAAIGRGESVAFVYVPSPGHVEICDFYRTVRDPNPLSGPLDVGLYGLDKFANPANPTDPVARFRYFVTQTPDELEEELDHLLGVGRDDRALYSSPVIPDLIVVYGVDQLFAVEGLSTDGVISRLERLFTWINTYSARCAQTGATMWFGRSLDFHDEDAPPIVRAINDVLYRNCAFGLAVDPQLPGEETRTCADYKSQTNVSLPSVWDRDYALDKSTSRTWQASLYKGDTLIDKVRWPYTTTAVVGNDFLDRETSVENMTAFNSKQSSEQQCASTPSPLTVESLTKAAETLAIAARDLTAAIEALKTV